MGMVLFCLYCILSCLKFRTPRGNLLKCFSKGPIFNFSEKLANTQICIMYFLSLEIKVFDFFLVNAFYPSFGTLDTNSANREQKSNFRLQCITDIRAVIGSNCTGKTEEMKLGSFLILQGISNYHSKC